jgi:hypothetical protein
MMPIIARHQHIIARDRRLFAHNAGEHRRRCMTSSPDIQQRSRAMLVSIARDA